MKTTTAIAKIITRNQKRKTRKTQQPAQALKFTLNKCSYEPYALHTQVTFINLELVRISDVARKYSETLFILLTVHFCFSTKIDISIWICSPFLINITAANIFSITDILQLIYFTRCLCVCVFGCMFLFSWNISTRDGADFIAKSMQKSFTQKYANIFDKIFS